MTQKMLSKVANSQEEMIDDLSALLRTKCPFLDEKDVIRGYTADLCGVDGWSAILHDYDYGDYWADWVQQHCHGEPEEALAMLYAELSWTAELTFRQAQFSHGHTEIAVNEWDFACEYVDAIWRKHTQTGDKQ